MTDTKTSPAKRNCDGQPSLDPATCSAVRPETVQLHCPKCGAMRFNVHASDLAKDNGEVTCSNCGHVRTIKAMKGLSPCGQANLGLETFK